MTDVRDTNPDTPESESEIDSGAPAHHGAEHEAGEAAGADSGVDTTVEDEDEGDDLPAPSYNIAPTDRVAIVLDSAKTEPPTRRLEAARWGLVPAWAKDPGIGSKALARSRGF